MRCYVWWSGILTRTRGTLDPPPPPPDPTPDPGPGGTEPPLPSVEVAQAYLTLFGPQGADTPPPVDPLPPPYDTTPTPWLPFDMATDEARAAQTALTGRMAAPHSFHGQFTQAQAGNYATDPGNVDANLYDYQHWYPRADGVSGGTEGVGSITGTPVNGSSSVTCTATPSAWSGKGISGSGIQTGTVINSISGNVLNLSKPAIASPGAVTLAIYTDHRRYGYYTRDRYKPRPARGSADFHVQDMREEIRAAKAAGLHGFFVDILGTSGQIAQRYDDLLDAADAEGDFWLCPQPDGFGGTLHSSAAPGNLVAYLKAKWFTHACALKVDGNFIVAPYAPECVKSTLSGSTIDAAGGRAFWDSFINLCASTSGGPAATVDLWMFFQASWQRADCAPNFTGGTLGSRYKVFGRWGDRDPTSTGNMTDVNNGALPDTARTKYGKKGALVASPQDFRPDQQGIYEARNTECFRACWKAIIQGLADYVMLPTWNDFRENAMVCPTINHGYCWLDLTAYFLHWWLFGAPPTIIRDGMYLSHRPHHSGLAHGNFLSKLQTLWATIKGATPLADNVEALVFLTAPAQVEITVCGKVYSQTWPAGMNSYKVPLLAGTNGTVSARIIRVGDPNAAADGTVTSVTSICRVTTTPISQDLQYRVTSSYRGAF